MKTGAKNNSIQQKGFHIQEEKSVFDLICGMELKIEEAKFWSIYKGQIYYLCSDTCKGHFTNNPKMYLGE